MKYEFNRIIVETVDLDPAEYRGLTPGEIVDALRTSLPPGIDHTQVWNAAAEIYAAVGSS